MNNLLTVLRIFLPITLINLVSIIILVILKFNEWDIAATVITCTFSISILVIEILKARTNIIHPWSRPLLALCIVVGGASGFFWFFHLIHKLGHYQGDLADTLWTSVTIILTFIVSMLFVATAYKTSKYVLIEATENPDCDEMDAQLTLTQWAQQYFEKKQANKGVIHENVHPV